MGVPVAFLHVTVDVINVKDVILHVRVVYHVSHVILHVKVAYHVRVVIQHVTVVMNVILAMNVRQGMVVRNVT